MLLGEVTLRIEDVDFFLSPLALIPFYCSRRGDRGENTFSAGDSATLLCSVGLCAVGEGRGVESLAGSVYS